MDLERDLYLGAIREHALVTNRNLYLKVLKEAFGEGARGGVGLVAVRSRLDAFRVDLGEALVRGLELEGFVCADDLSGFALAPKGIRLLETNRLTSAESVEAPVCPYCRKTTELKSGKEVYPYRPDLHSFRYFVCGDCEAWCGLHADGKPLGTPAKADLRRLRQVAHSTFDPLWQKQHFPSRTAAYTWLAGQMDVPVEQCHMACFDEAQCRKVVAVVRRLTQGRPHQGAGRGQKNKRFKSTDRRFS